MKPFIICIALLTAGRLAAASQFFESPDHRVSLVELYTSEGCSSCPPAERKLNDFAKHKGLWTDFIPVAFHVDYWNYIGWEDRFSNPEYTVRQREYSKLWNARTIYTPCFVINGEATRSPNPKVGKKNPGQLKAVLDGSKLSVTFSPTQKHPELQLWAAPLSGKETTAVKSGENRGRTLEHCFVALDLNSVTMQKIDGIWTAELNLNGTRPASALAIWISNGRNLEPIQATGGWLQ